MHSENSSNFMQSITNFYKPIKTFIMKKTLLYLTSFMLFSALSINAQTKSWTFDNTTTWPVAGITSVSPVVPVLIDQLVCVPHTSSTSGLFAAQQTTTIGYTDGTSYTSIIKTNGNGAATNYTPTVRFFYFTIDGNATVKVWFKHGSNSTAGTRTLFLSKDNSAVTAGTSILVGSTPVEMATTGILNYTTTTGAGKYYIYGDNSLYISKIEVTGANVNTPALATNKFQKELDITVFAKQNKIYLSNIKSSTKVNVYNVLGSLVKTAQVDADSSLDINSGIYIVNAKSADGEKSVKVIVQ